MKTEQITPFTGLEITDVDLTSVDLDGASGAELQALLVQHKVLVFRDQHLAREDHKRFARSFGEIHIHPSKRNGLNKEDPELFIVNTPADAPWSNGEAWHSDVSSEEIPPAISLLYVSKIPDNGGGDTAFANMNRIFTELSPAMQKFLLNKTAYHDGEIDLANYGIRLREGETYPKATHPVVIAHPVSGEPVLFVNGCFVSHIVELSRWESDVILKGLYQFTATNMRAQCRVKWRPGTLVVWDNRAVQHQAIRDYAGFARYGERVSVMDGMRPVAWQADL